MAGITIFRQIIIKELVTEESKRKNIEIINQELSQINEILIEHDEKKNKALTEVSLRGADQVQVDKFRQQFNSEAAHYHTKRDELLVRISNENELVVGEENVIGTVEGPFELKVGQSLNEATGTEIIIKDGVIAEIKNN